MVIVLNTCTCASCHARPLHLCKLVLALSLFSSRAAAGQSRFMQLPVFHVPFGHDVHGVYAAPQDAQIPATSCAIPRGTATHQGRKRNAQGPVSACIQWLQCDAAARGQFGEQPPAYHHLSLQPCHNVSRGAAACLRLSVSPMYLIPLFVYIPYIADTLTGFIAVTEAFALIGATNNACHAPAKFSQLWCHDHEMYMGMRGASVAEMLGASFPLSSMMIHHHVGA